MNREQLAEVDDRNRSRALEALAEADRIFGDMSLSRDEECKVSRWQARVIQLAADVQAAEEYRYKLQATETRCGRRVP